MSSIAFGPNTLGGRKTPVCTSFAALSTFRSLWRHFLRLPIVFATLHLSYGLGFWGGILRFGPPWRRVEADVPAG